MTAPTPVPTHAEEVEAACALIQQIAELMMDQAVQLTGEDRKLMDSLVDRTLGIALLLRRLAALTVPPSGYRWQLVATLDDAAPQQPAPPPVPSGDDAELLAQMKARGDWRPNQERDWKAAARIEALTEEVEKFKGVLEAWSRHLLGERQRGDKWMADARKAESALAASERERERLRELIAEMKPHWDAMTHKRIWTADLAGVMASIRTRIDAALKGGSDA